MLEEMGLWLGARLASGEDSSSQPDWAHLGGPADSGGGSGFVIRPKWRWPKAFSRSHRFGKHTGSSLIACVTFLHPIAVSQPSSVCSQIFSPVPSCESSAPFDLQLTPSSPFALTVAVQLVLLCHLESYPRVYHLILCFLFLRPVLFPFQTKDKPVNTHQFTKPWNIRVSQNYVWPDQSYHRLSLNLDISNQINPGCV